MLIKKYENRDGIKIDILEDFIDNILEEVLAIYNDEYNIPYYYEAQVDKWQGQISFATNADFLIDFLKKYDQYFMITNDYLMLRSDVTYETLMRLEEQEKTDANLGLRFETPLEFRSSLDTLKINSIEKFLQNYLKCERLLEKAIKEEKRSDIIHGYLMRSNFLKWLEGMPTYVVEAFKNVAFIMKMETEEHRTSNYHPPIDKKRWEESEFFAPDNSLLDIEDRIYDDFQFAIFGDGSLAEEKVFDFIEDIYLAKMACDYSTDFDYDEEDYEELAYMDESSESNIDYEDEENNSFTEDMDTAIFDDDRKLFYLIFLKRLNSYINNYGLKPILAHAKSRLIYALDMPEYCLINENNLENEIAKIKDSTNIKDYGEFLTGEIRFMASDIFNEGLVEERTFLKLIFMGTYYEITHDQQFKVIIEEHRDSKLYALFQPIIFNKAENYVLKRKKK